MYSLTSLINFCYADQLLLRLLSLVFAGHRRSLFSHCCCAAVLRYGSALLLPAVGKGARTTNYDYTHGKLGELIDVIIESGAKLFVTAVGVPPAWAVKRLYGAGILIMNMVGSTRHVEKALAVGIDIICAQGSEGGGHTGDVGTIPAKYS